MTATPNALPVQQPNLQISFYYRLQTLREVYLFEAMSRTLRELDISKLDVELSNLVSKKHLARAASFGLRGEIFFPVPYLLESNPFLLGYYRMLYGISQKEFYKSPFGAFKPLEESGTLTERIRSKIPILCKSLVETGQLLLDGIDQWSLSIVQDLQMLTLGAFLRGSENNAIGQGATKEVFELMKDILSNHLKESTDRTMIVENDNKEIVLIEFLSDPDIRVTKKTAETIQPLVSMEIKGGEDVSNIHNRIGEAEKSHNKARNFGFTKFWTILKAIVDLDMAKDESPSTTRFFFFHHLKDKKSKEYRDFRKNLGSIIGIKNL